MSDRRQRFSTVILLSTLIIVVFLFWRITLIESTLQRIRSTIVATESVSLRVELEGRNTTTGTLNRLSDSGMEPLLLFLSVNCANVKRNPPPVWLEDCQLPKCQYQVFTDPPSSSSSSSMPSSSSLRPAKVKSHDDEQETERIPSSRTGEEDNVVYYPHSIPRGRLYFADRGRFQMEWAIEHAATQFGVGDFEYYLRVDEDGYLCVQNVLSVIERHHNANRGGKQGHHDIRAPPLIWGRFHCDRSVARMDENFMLFSRTAIDYFIQGWKTQQVPYHGRLTLALNIGTMLETLHHRCGWTYWSEGKERIRWDEPMVDQLTAFPMTNVASSCSTHIWYHHMNPNQIQLMRRRNKHAIDATPGLLSMPTANATSCPAWGNELPPFQNLKRVEFEGHFASFSASTEIPCQLKLLP